MPEFRRIKYRRAWISREGFSFLFVLLFISVGAVVRQVNLLFVLAGLLIAALLINWRYALTLIAKLSVRRGLPEIVHSHVPFTVDVFVESSHRYLVCWSVNVRDRVFRKQDPIGEGGGRPRKAKPVLVTANIAQVLPQGEGRASYRCQLDQRGAYEFGPMELSTRFPLGLVRAFGSIRCTETILVAPTIGRLSSKWDSLVDGHTRLGEQRSRERSVTGGGDFHAIRSWRSGDSRRSIHWRSSARTGKLEVREFEALQRSSLTMVLDLWCPDEDKRTAVEPHGSRIDAELVELAISFVASAVMHAARQQSGKIFLAVAGDTREEFSGRNDRELQKRIMSCLASVSPFVTTESASADDRDIDWAIDSAVENAGRGGRVVVVSTRAELGKQFNPAKTDGLGQAGNANGADLIWVNVVDDDVGQLFDGAIQARRA